MNPVLEISVNEKNKAISVTSGIVSVGSRIDVVVRGLQDIEIPNWGEDDRYSGRSLRVRIVDQYGRDMAIYPLNGKSSESPDEWEDDGDSYLCSGMRLDTRRMRGAFAGVPYDGVVEFGVIVDSSVDSAQYGVGKLKVRNWVPSGREDPTLLPDWRDLENNVLAKAEEAAQSEKNARDLAEMARQQAAIADDNATRTEGLKAEAKSYRDDAIAASDGAKMAKFDAETAAAEAKDAALNYPRIGENGNWFASIGGEFVDTGVRAEGVSGRDGADGAPGRDGADGKDGVDGKDGAPGADGKDGAPGATGAKAVSIVLSSVDASGGNVYTITFDDGTTHSFTAPRGAAGMDGRDGAIGPQGIPGPAGQQGPQGVPGPQGERGEKGEKGDPGDGASIDEEKVKEIVTRREPSDDWSFSTDEYGPLEMYWNESSNPPRWFLTDENEQYVLSDQERDSKDDYDVYFPAWRVRATRQLKNALGFAMESDIPKTAADVGAVRMPTSGNINVVIDSSNGAIVKIGAGINDDCGGILQVGQESGGQIFVGGDRVSANVKIVADGSGGSIEVNGKDVMTEIGSKASKESVDAIADSVSTNNRFLVGATSAAIQTREGEEAEWTDEIRVDKGYDALTGETVVKLDKSVQSIVVSGETTSLDIVLPDAVDGTVRDICLYVSNTTETDCALNIPDGTYYGDDPNGAVAKAGQVTVLYFTEIPVGAWLLRIVALDQHKKPQEATA